MADDIVRRAAFQLLKFSSDKVIVLAAVRQALLPVHKSPIATRECIQNSGDRPRDVVVGGPNASLVS